MPKKIVIEEGNWDDIKQYLPKNWCQHISNNLYKRGISINPQTISDAKNGRIKNLLIRKQVWEEIKKVSKRNKSLLNSLRKISHS